MSTIYLLYRYELQVEAFTRKIIIYYENAPNNPCLSYSYSFILAIQGNNFANLIT